MKLPTISLVLYLGLAAQVFAAKTIPNHAAANRVLGQADFVSDSVASPASSFSLNRPFGIAVDPISRKVFVSDFSNDRILRYPNAASLTNGAGAEAVFGQPRFSSTSGGSGDGELNGPIGLYFDRRGRLWVADYINNRVLMYEAASYRSDQPFPDKVLGQPDFTTTSSGTTASKMNDPWALWVDTEDRLWVAEISNRRVLRFDSVSTKSNGAAADGVLGQSLFTTSSSGTSSSSMNGPCGVTVSSSGTLYVADRYNNRVIRFDNAASLGNGSGASAVLGQANFNTSTSGTTASTMNDSLGVFITPDDSLWVTDRNNQRVLRFNKASTLPNGSPANGVVGQPDFTTGTLDPASRRSLRTPYCQTFVDAAGSLWIGDTDNNRVLRFAPDMTKPRLVVKPKPKRVSTKKNLVIRGTASDAYGITRVQFRVGNGKWKKAKGTTNWKATAKLKSGANRVTVRAFDSVGNVSRNRIVKVRYKPSAAPALLGAID